MWVGISYRDHPRLESRQSSYESRRGRDRCDTGVILDDRLKDCAGGAYLAVACAIVMEGEQLPLGIMCTLLRSNLAIFVFVDVVSKVKLEGLLGRTVKERICDADIPQSQRCPS